MESAGHQIDTDSGLPILKTTKLTMLEPHQALENWGAIADILQHAIPYTCGRMTLEDYRKAVEEDNAMIIIAWDPSIGEVYAAFYCEGGQYPHKKVFHLSLCAGRDINEWIHLYPDMKIIAKSMGFEQIEIVGRPGWSKALNMRETSRVFIEEL